MVVAICDDCKEDSIHLKEHLIECMISCQRTYDILTYESGSALLQAVAEGDTEIDLLFLDILMPEVTGMDVAHKLRRHGKQMPIVFLTSSPDFALQSYDVLAFSYLLKPLQREKLQVVIQRFFAQSQSKTVILQSRAVRVQDIIYVESVDKKVMVKLLDGTLLEFYDKLNMLKKKLDDPCFLRCHQSFLVNMHHVLYIEEDCFVMKNKDKALIRKREFAQIRRQYFSFIVGS